jgi:hypothetical protein
MFSVGKAPPRRAMVKCRTGGLGVGVVAWEVKVRVVRMRRERRCMVEFGRMSYRFLGDVVRSVVVLVEGDTCDRVSLASC